MEGITDVDYEEYSNPLFSVIVPVYNIEEYLKKRKNISLIIFLIDIRHEPSANDRLMYRYIVDSGMPCMVLTNKADKIAITKVDDAVKSLQSILNPLKDLIFLPFSAERKIYTEAVWNEIEAHLQRDDLN